jgi:hypothetical protein
MWPFSSSKQPATIPTIVVGDLRIHWNKECDWWDFSDDEYDYTFTASPDFDTSVLDQLAMAKQWITDLDAEIETEIAKHLKGWCEWNGEKEVVEIDVSRLDSDQEIDISYAGSEEWGDLLVNIVVNHGRITNSYAGD